MHIFNCNSDSIHVPNGPWLDCFHQQTYLGPCWVWVHIESLSVVALETSPDMKQTADDNHYMRVWKLLTHPKATARSLYHRLVVTAGWPSDVRTILWAQQGHRVVILRAPYDYRKSLRSFLGKNDKLKSYVVLTITVRCPYGDRTTSLRCVYGLRAYDFFKFVIARS